jgi:hypothetical protein
MPPPRYIPAALTYHQLVMNSVDFQDRLDTLYAMWSDAFNAWRNSIQRNEAQEAHEKVYKSIKRRITLVTNRLHETRKEKMNRDLNSLRELVQNAQKLRATQGENAGGP